MARLSSKHTALSARGDAGILVGLDVDEFSVSVPAIASVKAQVRALNYADAQQLPQTALKCGTAADVRLLASLSA